MNKITQILADIRAGKMIIVTDSSARENEGDVMMAADFATPQKINFMVTNCRGLVCVAITQERAKKLKLDPMVKNNTAQFHTNFTISIDARHNTSTGISVFDRAETIRVVTGHRAKPNDLKRPGHIFPLVANAHGVLGRPGHTEAAVDLPRLAGLNPAGVLCEILDETGRSARGKKLTAFAKKHKLKIISIREIIDLIKLGTKK